MFMLQYFIYFCPKSLFLSASAVPSAFALDAIRGRGCFSRPPHSPSLPSFAIPSLRYLFLTMHYLTLLLAFLDRIFSRINHSFSISPGRFGIPTAFLSSLTFPARSKDPTHRDSLASTNTAVSLDGSLLYDLESFYQAGEEAHPLVLLLAGVLEYHIVSLALLPRRPLSLL